jgi:hypothetical protein
MKTIDHFIGGTASDDTFQGGQTFDDLRKPKLTYFGLKVLSV